MAGLIRFLIKVGFWYWFYDSYQKQYGKFPDYKVILSVMFAMMLVEFAILKLLYFTWYNL